MKPEHVTFPADWSMNPEDGDMMFRDPEGHPWLLCEDDNGRACIVSFDPETRTARQRYVDENGGTLSEFVLSGVQVNMKQVDEKFVTDVEVAGKQVMAGATS